MPPERGSSCRSMGASEMKKAVNMRRADEGEHDRLPHVGAEELRHATRPRPASGARTATCLRVSSRLDHVAEGDADEQHRDARDPAGDELHVGPGVQDLVEVDDGQVPGGAQPGPEHEQAR